VETSLPPLFGQPLGLLQVGGVGVGVREEETDLEALRVVQIEILQVILGLGIWCLCLEANKLLVLNGLTNIGFIRCSLSHMQPTRTLSTDSNFIASNALIRFPPGDPHP
jgi:hypothetical protein